LSGERGLQSSVKCPQLCVILAMNGTIGICAKVNVNVAEKSQVEQHYWNGCKCSNCGKIRNERHTYESVSGNCQEKCSICGRINHTHDWQVKL